MFLSVSDGAASIMFVPFDASDKVVGPAYKFAYNNAVRKAGCVSFTLEMSACNPYFLTVILTSRHRRYLPGDKNRLRCMVDYRWLAWNLPWRECTLCAKVKKLIQNELVKCEDSIHFFYERNTMNEKFSPSKILLIVAAVMSFAVAGCERRGADTSSGASGASGTSGSSGSSSGSPGAAGSSSPGSSGGGTSGGGGSGSGSK
jgi:hypothetical protein